MKALSVRQPWTWLIVQGYKDIENRDWKYFPKYSGPLLIHASKGCTKKEYLAAKEYVIDINPSIKIPPLSSLDRGGIVGKVFMKEAVNESLSPWFFGPMGLVFCEQEVLPFLPCKGQLGFFRPDILSDVKDSFTLN